MNKLYEENDIQMIADTIREKNCKTDTYKVADMPQAIKDLPRKDLYEKALANQKTNSATGNPLYLEGSADMPLKKLEIQGNMEQERYITKSRTSARNKMCRTRWKCKCNY